MNNLCKVESFLFLCYSLLHKFRIPAIPQIPLQILCKIQDYLELQQHI